MQPDILGHAWKPSFDVKGSAAEVKATPGFGQALETVETVNDTTAEARGHEPDGAPGVYAELKIVTVNFNFGQRMLDQFPLAVKAESVGHSALDIVDRPLERAQ